MKQAKLFLAAALAVCSLNLQAQDIIDTCKTVVVDPNVTFDVPQAETDYLDITKAWIPCDSTAEKPRYKAGSDGTYQFDNMRNNEFAVFHLNVTKGTKFKVNLQTASKKDDVSLTFDIYNADTKQLEATATVSVENTGNWSKFVDTYFITEKALTEGKKNLVLTFHGPKETVNARKIQFAEFANQQTYSLFTYINPTDEAGTVKVTPDANAYIFGTEVTVTATANTGYKFVNWTDADDEVVSTNPAYTFPIQEDTDLNANFEEISLVNNIPGTLDPQTGEYNGGAYKLNPGGKIIVGTDTTLVADGAVSFDNFRNEQFVTLQTQVAQEAVYSISLLAATKNDGSSMSFCFYAGETLVDSVNVATPNTTSWTTWKPVAAKTAKALPTTTNKLVIYFLGEKYTVNAMNVKLDVDDPTGISTATASTLQKDAPIYTLGGTRLQTTSTARLPKGVYIQGGRKIVIR